MDNRTVQPCMKLAGGIRVPGDKSVSHRLAMLCALVSGRSRISGYLMSEDCINTLKAMEKLGAKVDVSGDDLTIWGTGGVFSQPDGVLDMGNSGTGIRLLTGLLASQPVVAELTGDESLRSRPMMRIKDPLEKMGASIDLLADGKFAPMRVSGGRLKGIEYVLPVASAQVKSCVLLAGLTADGETVVVEPRPTRDHTEKLLKALGVDIRVDGLRISLKGTSGRSVVLRSGDWVVPGDFSSAAFWLVAAACREGADVVVENIGLNSRRTALLDVLKRMGANVLIRPTGQQDQDVWEPMGDVTVVGCGLRGTEIGGDEIPNLIDELPILAVAGALAEGITVIKDAAELRVKESDRIATVVEGLRAFGVKVEERSDGMVVHGGCKIRGGIEIDSHADHRIAMAMAILALFADGPVLIKDIACIATSYPGFWTDMEALTK